MKSTKSILTSQNGPAMTFEILAECSTTKARLTNIHLTNCPDGPVQGPVFMPVGTQGTIKGVTVDQMKSLGCRILLGNTYHLGHRPGPEILKKAGGLHKFMAWPRAILTDSGGFQMVSLVELSETTEDGVKFISPHDKTEMLLTPEHSVGCLQAALGSDVVMQLDHVLHVLTPERAKVQDAMRRSIRWLDRCIEAHEKKAETQNIFAITQGGLDLELRKECIEEMIKRKDKIPGFAIGGLSGGESRDSFWCTITYSTGLLPRDRPRYLMGVGFPMDLVVCVALGVDMFDCVYPTRTGRFGNALVPWGIMNLSNTMYSLDFGPIQEDCECIACRKRIPRSWFHIGLGARQPVASSMISQHNICYLLSLMANVRKALLEDRYPEFLVDFFRERYPDCIPEGRNSNEYEGQRPPGWIGDALSSVNVDISHLGRHGVDAKRMKE